MVNLAEQTRYTYAEYLTWGNEKRYEIIEGIPYAMASPSQAHQEIVGEIFNQLYNFLKGKPCKAFVAPFDVRLNVNSFDDTVVVPDILVVCDKSKLNGKSLKGAPDLIIEILSPFNVRHDTVKKYRQYQKAGVKEYWIVDPVTQTVQVHTLENGRYIGRTYNDDDIIPVHTLNGCKINLTDVFYDTIEVESDDELITKQSIIEALKINNISDEQIEKIIKKMEN
jgi:Uma2 family endonuclease